MELIEFLCVCSLLRGEQRVVSNDLSSERMGEWTWWRPLDAPLQ